MEAMYIGKLAECGKVYRLMVGAGRQMIIIRNRNVRNRNDRVGPSDEQSVIGSAAVIGSQWVFSGSSSVGPQ